MLYPQHQPLDGDHPQPVATVDRLRAPGTPGLAVHEHPTLPLKVFQRLAHGLQHFLPATHYGPLACPDGGADDEQEKARTGDGQTQDQRQGNGVTRLSSSNRMTEPMTKAIMPPMPSAPKLGTNASASMKMMPSATRARPA